jgi:hypothetical protein
LLDIFPQILSSVKHLQIMFTPTNDTEILSAFNETNHTSKDGKSTKRPCATLQEPASQTGRYDVPPSWSHFALQAGGQLAPSGTEKSP